MKDVHAVTCIINSDVGMEVIRKIMHQMVGATEISMWAGLEDPDASLAEGRTAAKSCSFQLWSTYTTASNFAVCLSFGL